MGHLLSSKSSQLTLVGLPRASNLQHSLSEPICDTVESLQQTVIFFMFLRLIEEVGLHWLGLLPAADAYTDESHRFAWQITVKIKRPGLAQDHSFVVGRDGELKRPGSD